MGLGFVLEWMLCRDLAFNGQIWKTTIHIWITSPFGHQKNISTQVKGKINPYFLMEKIKIIQSDLNTVIETMRRNVHTLSERGEATADLEDRAEQLHEESFQFVIRVMPWYKACWYNCVKRCTTMCTTVCSRTQRVCRNCCTKAPLPKRVKVMDV